MNIHESEKVATTKNVRIRYMNIYLIGYRCVGKTTVGKCLADRLGWGFADSDHKIAEDRQMSISEMVSEFGWAYFREIECRILRTLTSADRHVVATGGGVILNSGNIEAMKASGFVVWLKASPETIRQRMSTDVQTPNQRPSLSDKGILDEITDMLAQRNPLYDSAADIAVFTDETHLEAICDKIIFAMADKMKTNQ